MLPRDSYGRIPADINNRSDALAMGTADLDMKCATGNGTASHCDLVKPVRLSTKIEPPVLDEAANCESLAARYQSWQIGNWLRTYELAPGYLNPPSQDTGPYFMLKNLAVDNLFECSDLFNMNGTFLGQCHSTVGNRISTSVTFTFDLEVDFLTVTQNWLCGDS